MFTFPVTGGCHVSYNSGDGFLNYGALSSSPQILSSYPIYFILPYDGYVKYASIAINEAQGISASYTLHNLDTAQSANGILVLDSDSKKTYIELSESQLTFSAGDRLVWSSDNDINATSTVLTTYCTVNVSDKSFLCVTASLTGGFSTGAFPFSYGAGAHNGVGGNIEQHIPTNTYLRAVGVTANESGSPLSSNAIIGIYNNVTQIQTVTVNSGTDKAFQVFGGNDAFNSGSRLFLKSENTLAGLNHCVVLLLFEIV
jgi:hypothetical protein